MSGAGPAFSGTRSISIPKSSLLHHCACIYLGMMIFSQIINSQLCIHGISTNK